MLASSTGIDSSISCSDACTEVTASMIRVEPVRAATVRWKRESAWRCSAGRRRRRHRVVGLRSRARSGVGEVAARRPGRPRRARRPGGSPGASSQSRRCSAETRAALRANVPRARRVTTVPPPRPRVVSTSPAWRSAAIASRRVAAAHRQPLGELALRPAACCRPGRRPAGSRSPSCSTHASKAWCPRTGRSTASVRCSAGSGGHGVSLLRRSRRCQWSEFIPIFGAASGRRIPAGLASDRSHPVRAWRNSWLISTRLTHDDEKHLAKLGYSQELNRSWSGFSNFAISFSIISILAGCFTNFGAGFNNGGPISISWSWPILGVFILIIGFTMSELVSAYPTSGGIYWWASKLGGPAAGFFTGWLNLIGLVAVTAGVSYGCATFIDLTISTFSESYAADYSLTRVFIIFVIVLVAGRRCSTSSAAT